MKHLLPILLLSLSLVTLARESEVRIVTSPTHSLYYTLECLMNAPHRSSELAGVLRGRVGNWYPVERALEGWGNALQGEELSPLRFPKVQGRDQQLAAVLEKVSLQAENGQDMARRVRPWLGPDHASKLEEALTTLEPLYRSYVWAEAEPLVQQRLSEIRSELKQGDFAGSFQLVSGFFRGTLPPGEQPTLALVPYLRAPGIDKVTTHGHSAGSLQVMELVVDRPVTDEVGVIFHEFVHAVHAGQEPAESERWRERLYSHGLTGRLAYTQLSEGLATAIGNGWFHQKVKGEPDTGSWYSDPVIDTYGKALLPVVREAVEEGRPPTGAELDQMVEAFRRSLPEAEATFDVVAANFLTVSSRPEINHAVYQDELMRLGPVRSSLARSWDGDRGTTSTFTLIWLKEGERDRLREFGWREADRSGWDGYRLRRTDSGWELAFQGEREELFQLLRRLQVEGLKDSRAE